MNVVAVIPAWRARDRLPEVLGALAGQVASVVVVDNASGDGTVAWLATAWPAAEVIANDANLGYAAAVARFKADDKAPDKLDRSVLPIPEPKVALITTLDARNAKAPPRFEVKAPKGAPNVLIILIDDMGFGQSSAFGGPIHMPTAEKLAKGGLRYNRFHTTALCSPTRAALLTGRNHHVCNMGSIVPDGRTRPQVELFARNSMQREHTLGQEPASPGLAQLFRTTGKTRSVFPVNPSAPGSCSGNPWSAPGALPGCRRSRPCCSLPGCGRPRR